MLNHTLLISLSMLCRIFCSSFTTSSSVTVSGCRLLSADSHSRARDPSSYPAQVHCVSRLTSRVRLGEATPELYVNFAVSIQSDFNEAVIRFPFLLTVIQTEADTGWHLSVAWMARITNYRGMNLISPGICKCRKYIISTHVKSLQSLPQRTSGAFHRWDQ